MRFFPVNLQAAGIFAKSTLAQEELERQALGAAFAVTAALGGIAFATTSCLAATLITPTRIVGRFRTNGATLHVWTRAIPTLV